jgi:hypothetical protein
VSHGALFQFFVRRLTVHIFDILSRIAINFLDFFWGVARSVILICRLAFHDKLSRFFFPVSQGK